MEAPAFIFECLEKELWTIQVNLLQKVATKYDLDLEELQRECLQPVTVSADEQAYICKRQRRKPLPEDDKRCLARVWNRGKGGQCTRMKCEGGDFCKQHMSGCRHGIIGEAPPKKVFGKTTRALYK